MPRTRGIPRTYTFTVKGSGPFPIDMLRYDLCYPKSEQDSYRLEKTFQPRDRSDHVVRLVSAKAPTEARWGSFGWLVESVE